MGFGLDFGSLGAGILNFFGNKYTTDKSIKVSRENLALMKEQQDWERHVYQETKEREDTAMQRRVQDMQQAGLHPALAAGSQGATSAAVGGSTTPQSSEGEKYSMMLDSMYKAAQIANIKAEIGLKKAETGLRNVEAYSTAQDTAIGLMTFPYTIQELSSRIGVNYTTAARMEKEIELMSENIHLTRENVTKVIAEVSKIKSQKKLTDKQTEQLTYDLLFAQANQLPTGHTGSYFGLPGGTRMYFHEPVRGMNRPVPKTPRRGHYTDWRQEAINNMIRRNR